jgi:predicted acetyltransferase
VTAPLPCLERPALRHRAAFLEVLDDYARAGERDKFELYAPAGRDFADYCDQLHQQELGARLPAGWVPGTTLWMLDGGQRICGIVRIRHRLNAFLEEHGGHLGYDVPPSRRRQGHGHRLLELGLVEAARLGLRRVLLVCDDDNLASLRIIERAGGVHQDTRQPPGEPVPLRRYWIELGTRQAAGEQG